MPPSAIAMFGVYVISIAHMMNARIDTLCLLFQRCPTGGQRLDGTESRKILLKRACLRWTDHRNS